MEQKRQSPRKRRGNPMFQKQSPLVFVAVVAVFIISYYFSSGSFSSKRPTKTYSEEENFAAVLKEAKTGKAEALHKAGLAYYFGNGVEKNSDEAESFLRESATQGNYLAINALERYFPPNP